jgi:hypothetical protein
MACATPRPQPWVCCPLAPPQDGILTVAPSPRALLPTLPYDLPDSSALLRDRSLGAVSMLPSVTCAMFP